jgi:phytoene synthase
MAVETHSWEHHLLDLAIEGLDDQPLYQPVAENTRLLNRAFEECTRITRQHSRTFYLASGLLPPSKREAARALYAFSRISDDIVDQPEGDPMLALEEWKRRALYSQPGDNDLVPIAWAEARLRYDIPALYSDQLISGIARDLQQTRYATFSDLATYCYGVACTVGLMSMHITGFDGPEAIPYALRLGVALQITNILRDVAEDWRNGRLYLPLEELQAFGLDESDIVRGQVDDRWRAFMQFQIDRARQLYHTALPGIARLDPDGRFAIAAAAELYQGILADIENHDYDVFSRRAYVSGFRKVLWLPGIWFRATALRY